MRKPFGGASDAPLHRGAFARLTREYLERVASPAMALEIIEAALALERLPAIPEESEAYALFVCGSFLSAAEEVLGEAAAHAVIEDLSSVFPRQEPRAESGFRRRDLVLDQIAIEKARHRIVILASGDAQRRRALREQLDDILDVHEAGSPSILMRLTEEHLDRDLVLVVDGEVPGLPASMLVTLARLLPSSAWLVVRGAAPGGFKDVQVHVEVLDANAPDSNIVALCLGVQPVRAKAPIIVVADTDQVWRAELVTELSAAGYDVSMCGNGMLALETAVARGADLLITDLDMPDLSGLAVTRLLRLRMGVDAPRIVLLTSSGLAADQIGVSAVLSKDERVDGVVAAVREILEPRS